MDRAKIAKIAEKGKRYAAGIERQDIFLAVLIVLVGSAGFGLGHLSALRTASAPVQVTMPESASRDAHAAAAVQSGIVVGSAHSDVYHFPWCSGAQRIQSENKVTFDSIEAAKAAGYRAAKNCKGLE